jgi:hypothetical protein
MWVYPTKNGTLVSAAEQVVKRRSTLFHITVRDRRLEYEETSNHFYTTTPEGAVLM